MLRSCALKSVEFVEQLKLVKNQVLLQGKGIGGWRNSWGLEISAGG